MSVWNTFTEKHSHYCHWIVSEPSWSYLPVAASVKLECFLKNILIVMFWKMLTYQLWTLKGWEHRGVIVCMRACLLLVTHGLFDKCNFIHILVEILRENYDPLAVTWNCSISTEGKMHDQILDAEWKNLKYLGYQKRVSGWNFADSFATQWTASNLDV